MRPLVIESFRVIVSNNRPVLFLHIPKTGGLSIAHSLLPRLYARDEIFSTSFTRHRRENGRGVGLRDRDLNAIGLFTGVRAADDIWYPHSLERAKELWDRLPAERREKVKMIHGTHLDYGFQERLSLPSFCFTMLREPVDRAISHYYFGRDKRLPPDDPAFFEHFLSVVEANLQTRLLAGDQNPESPLSPEDLLARARENLRSCAAVGLTEHFDESLVLYRKAFGWKQPFYEVRNKGKRRPRRDAFPAEVLRRVKEANRLDCALYETARELYADEVRKYGPDFEGDVRSYRSGCRRWRSRKKIGTGFREVLPLIEERVIDPAYESLAKWGILRALVPLSLKPRVERALEHNRLYFDLKMGRRRVGSFDPAIRRWNIQRPFRLFLDEQALPLASLPPKA